MIRAVVRRSLVLLAAAVGATAAVATLAGLAAGGSIIRAISVGFYCAGALAVIAGFAIGSRAQLRRSSPRRPEETGLTEADVARESREAAALLILNGLGLLLLAILVDPEARLV